MSELKDVTTPEANPAAASPVGTTPATISNKDAEEIGQLLLDSGYNKERLNELLMAPQALAAIKYKLENDPVDLVRDIERSNPGMGENIMDKLSKEYIDRYDRSGSSAGTAAPSGKDAASTEIFDKVRELTERVTRYETAEEQRRAAATDAQMAARYGARVDDLFGQLPEDKFPLADYEKGLIRDALSSRLASDPSIVQRVKMGNFVDVPKAFSSIVDGIAKGRQAKVDAETKARERSSAQMFPTFEGGPLELPKEFTAMPESNTPDDIWNVDGLVKALERTGR